MVNKDDYRKMLEQAVAELAELLARQEVLDEEREQGAARIAELQQGVIALGPLAGIQAQSKYADLLPDFAFFMPTGLKESVLAILAQVTDNRFLTPTAIRKELPNIGYEIKSKNILPSIHTVLKRELGRQVEVGDVNGKAGYRLIKKERPLYPNPLRRLMAGETTLPTVPEEPIFYNVADPRKREKSK